MKLSRRSTDIVGDIFNVIFIAFLIGGYRFSIEPMRWSVEILIVFCFIFALPYLYMVITKGHINAAGMYEAMRLRTDKPNMGALFSIKHLNAGIGYDVLVTTMLFYFNQPAFAILYAATMLSHQLLVRGQKHYLRLAMRKEFKGEQL